jgi:hypothetical protein
MADQVEKKRKPQWENLIRERRDAALALGLAYKDCIQIVAVTRGKVPKATYEFREIDEDGYIRVHNISRALARTVTFDPREITVVRVPDPRK